MGFRFSLLRRPLLRRPLVAVASLACAVTLVVPATAMSVGDSVPPTARAAVLPAMTTLVAPPAGITCRVVASGSVNYSCIIGHSVDGRSIVAQRQGNPASSRVLVVNGQMHGEEWPGPRTVDVIRAMPIPAGASYQVWTVRTINPDGGRIGRRFTSHGVDLNGNFPNKFLRSTHTGPRALSEPESRAMARFLSWVQPDLLISLHGFSEAVDTTGGGMRAVWARRYSALSNIKPAHAVPCSGPCHGNMTDWYTATSSVSGVAFTVEMPRSSGVVRGCGVPGRSTRATPIRCAAWAAVYLAARLPA